MKTKITHVWSNRKGLIRATVTFYRDVAVVETPCGLKKSLAGADVCKRMMEGKPAVNFP